MICEWTVTTYYVRCDRCSVLCPNAVADQHETEELAVALAERMGWEVTAAGSSGAPNYTWMTGHCFCPACKSWADSGEINS